MDKKVLKQPQVLKRLKLKISHQILDSPAIRMD